MVLYTHLRNNRPLDSVGDSPDDPIELDWNSDTLTEDNIITGSPHLDRYFGFATDPVQTTGMRGGSGSSSGQPREPEPLREERPGASRSLLTLSCSHQLLFEGTLVDNSMLQQCPLPIHIRAHRNDLSPNLLSYRGIPFHEPSEPSDWIDVYMYLQPALLQ